MEDISATTMIVGLSLEALGIFFVLFFGIRGILQHREDEKNGWMREGKEAPWPRSWW